MQRYKMRSNVWHPIVLGPTMICDFMDELFSVSYKVKIYTVFRGHSLSLGKDFII